MEPVFIGGAFREAQDPVGSFRAVNPATGESIGPDYPISGAADLDACLEAALLAAPALRDTDPAQIAAFLHSYAAGIDAEAASLAPLASAETGLAAEGRYLANELPRTTRQLRLAAEAALSHSWTLPVIDTQAGLRSCLAPLARPVFVLGPNNFPFAFNAISGGDFAAALAARNPVIAKGHPSHPQTTQALARLAAAALVSSGLPAAAVQLIHDLPRQLGLRLAGDRRLGAVAFTGSRPAGLALKAAADAAGVPAYVELSSCNPVALLPGALEERGDAIAAELLASCTLGAGQFCTSPGLVLLVDGPATRRFVEAAARHYAAAAPGLLLNQGVLSSLEESLRALTAAGARALVQGQRLAGAGFRHGPTLLSSSGASFLAAAPALQREAFGPATLLIIAKDADELCLVTAALEGNLTGTLYSTSDDEQLYRRVAPLLRDRVGRLIEDRMPTGVAVSPAMNHGGPSPATGHPGFTSVGLPASIRRFAALHSYDHVKDAHLPLVLRNQNPGRIWRSIDGRHTQEDLP